MNIKNYCLCCGFELDNPAWDEDIYPSDDICPCCGIHFGYDDYCNGNIEERKIFYLQRRELWISSNYKWFSKFQKKPTNWDPLVQLKNIL